MLVAAATEFSWFADHSVDLRIIVATAFLAVPLNVVLHETGHFVAAKALGLTVCGFRIGSGPALLDWRFGPTRFELRLIPARGEVIHTTTTSPRRAVAVLLAGPVVSLALAGLALQQSGRHPILMAVAVVSGAFVLGCLFGAGDSRSDGEKAAALVRGSRKRSKVKHMLEESHAAWMRGDAEQSFALLRTLAQKVAPMPPASAWLYIRAVDVGDEVEARGTRRRLDLKRLDAGLADKVLAYDTYRTLTDPAFDSATVSLDELEDHLRCHPCDASRFAMALLRLRQRKPEEACETLNDLRSHLDHQCLGPVDAAQIWLALAIASSIGGNTALARQQYESGIALHAKCRLRPWAEQEVGQADMLYVDSNHFPPSSGI